jgi:CRISPR/Cas system-associated exonuclease Cas4 (RecB family)
MDVIRASELGEYYYCARSWWLRRVVGLEPTGTEHRERGTASHIRHGWLVATSQRLLWIGLGLLIGGVGLLIWAS